MKAFLLDDYANRAQSYSREITAQDSSEAARENSVEPAPGKVHRVSQILSEIYLSFTIKIVATQKCS